MNDIYATPKSDLETVAETVEIDQPLTMGQWLWGIACFLFLGLLFGMIVAGIYQQKGNKKVARFLFWCTLAGVALYASLMLI